MKPEVMDLIPTKPQILPMHFNMTVQQNILRQGFDGQPMTLGQPRILPPKYFAAWFCSWEKNY